MKWDVGLIGVVKERHSDQVLNLEIKDGPNVSQKFMSITGWFLFLCVCLTGQENNFLLKQCFIVLY